MLPELNKQLDGPKEITPKNAQKILQDHGTIVTLDQATAFLEFLNKLAEISPMQFTSTLAQTRPVYIQPTKHLNIQQIRTIALKSKNLNVFEPLYPHRNN